MQMIVFFVFVALLVALVIGGALWHAGTLDEMEESSREGAKAQCQHGAQVSINGGPVECWACGRILPHGETSGASGPSSDHLAAPATPVRQSI